MIGMPNINVVFEGLVDSAVTRSSKGTACLILQDDILFERSILNLSSYTIEDTIPDIEDIIPDIEDTIPEVEDAIPEVEDTTLTLSNAIVKTYKGFTEVEEADYSADNYKIIEEVFYSDVVTLIVISLPSAYSFNDIKKYITKNVNWVTYTAPSRAEQKKLADFVKLENKSRTRRMKCICYGLEIVESDDMHIVNYTNETLTGTDDIDKNVYAYLGRLLGILTACRLDQSVTYNILTDLNSVDDIDEKDEAIGSGQFILVNDDEGVRIARGVNSLQTINTNSTVDMRYIAIVEAMDLIYEDIVTTFKNTYLGKFKNSYDNQVLLITAINSYFKELSKEDILDPNYNNNCYVDVDTQRAKWVSNGVTDAEDWSELEVKYNTWRTNVYLRANIKILNAMEDLEFIISM